MKKASANMMPEFKNAAIREAFLRFYPDGFETPTPTVPNVGADLFGDPIDVRTAEERERQSNAERQRRFRRKNQFMAPLIESPTGRISGTLTTQENSWNR